MANLRCTEAEERLPWYLHCGLAPAERQEVEDHLAGCPACRAALDQTRQASALYAEHLPAEALIDYAFGLPVEGPSRETLERHLAHCGECREELRLVEAEASEASADTSAATASQPRAPRLGLARAVTTSPRWGAALAMAAALAVVSGLSIWLAMRGSPPLPEGGIALAELQPEGTRTRGGDAAPVTLAAGRSAALLLTTERAEAFEEVRVRLRKAPGEPLLWEQGGLEPAFEGVYAVLVPARAVSPGEVELELEGRRGAEWSRLGLYRVRFAP